MERRTLGYFEAVARTGSLSEAARELSLTQPALSKQISRLESELGMKLFDRAATGMVLTAAGRELLTLGSDILARFERAEGALRGRFAGAPSFRVACPHTTANVLITPFMAASGAPIADVVIVPAAGVDAALQHDADIGISTMRPPDHRSSMLVALLAITTQAPSGVIDRLTRGRDHLDLSDLSGTIIVPRTGVSLIVRKELPSDRLDITIREAATGYIAQAHAAQERGIALVTELCNFGLKSTITHNGDRELLCPLYASWESSHYASRELRHIALQFSQWMSETPPWSRTSKRVNRQKYDGN